MEHENQSSMSRERPSRITYGRLVHKDEPPYCRSAFPNGRWKGRDGYDPSSPDKYWWLKGDGRPGNMVFESDCRSECAEECDLCYQYRVEESFRQTTVERDAKQQERETIGCIIILLGIAGLFIALWYA
jgi:hypothetical protein